MRAQSRARRSFDGGGAAIAQSPNVFTAEVSAGMANGGTSRATMFRVKDCNRVTSGEGILGSRGWLCHAVEFLSRTLQFDLGGMGH